MEVVSIGAERAGAAVRPELVLLSHRQVDQMVWRASQYEFEDVVAAVTDGVVRAPTGLPEGRGGAPVSRALAAAKRRSVGPARGVLTGGARRDAADVLFAVFSTPSDIRDLRRLDGWQHSSVKIAFLVELWATQVDAARELLAELAGFDHVFVFSRGALPALRSITGRPCHYLATGVDTTLFAPRHPRPPRRSIDVHAYGRRSPVTHAALVGGLRSGRISYVYPTVAGPFAVTDYREHRLVTAHLLQRSTFTVVNRINDSPERLARTGGEEALTNRYFEAVAAGCVMLGTPARCDDFAEAFPWEDAILTVRADEPGIVDHIADLQRDPERLSGISVTNVVNSLRRHDWAHRWAEISAVAGIGTTPALNRRLDELESIARGTERDQGRS